MRYLVIAFLVSLSMGCKEKSEPCSGMTFDEETLPMTFSVSSRDSNLGTVTMDAQQNVEFKPDANADEEKLKMFLADFEQLTKSDQANYKYSDRDNKGTHYSCGGSVKKGTPQYPGAFKMALYSDYYEIDDKK